MQRFAAAAPVLGLMAALVRPDAVGAEDYFLDSLSETRAYGLFFTVPEAGCGRVRYAVSDKDGLIGHTPPLAPGESALVRIGKGYGAGVHALTITSTGCVTGPPSTKRVALSKASPDHGWRGLTPAP